MVEKSTGVQLAKEPTTLTPLTFEGIFERMDAVFDTISRRAYDIFERNGRLLGRDWEDWFQAERELFHPVHIHVAESDDALAVKAEVPGFSEKELEINVEPRRIIITGKRESAKEEKKGKTVYCETCSDQLMRIIHLPAEVEAEKATATLKNGILELNMPKTAKAKARTIRIQPKAA
ncbi:MAG: Hsp20/alpha crystallin family protein [Acidobacteriia bacterium]|nr:Hsp20/alpha crystallin family protein [Terriglobia bacterium]